MTTKISIFHFLIILELTSKYKPLYSNPLAYLTYFGSFDLTQNLGPPPPCLELSQISNSLTGFCSPVSKWTWIGFKMIKTVFRYGTFYWYPLAYRICFSCFWSQVKACKSNIFFLVIRTQDNSNQSRNLIFT